MAQELIIHIGLPKTGSTALQAFFSRNREELLKHSIDYLPMGEFRQGQAGGIASGNGAYVARSMLPAQDPAYLSWDESRIAETFRIVGAKLGREKPFDFLGVICAASTVGLVENP